jgi:eukaryotic-like serine/threonine-protein kinase
MPSPTTKDAFVDVVRQAKVAEPGVLDAVLTREDAAGLETPRQMADLMIREGVLTSYQSSLLLKGRTDGFRIGPYRILERLGYGATSNVYLCRRAGTAGRVAVKVMATMQAKSATAVKRFYREARAASSLEHPNLVKVRDIDWDNDTNYLVMDYVDGSSIQDIIQKAGPMDPARAAHYIKQAASGLGYAHERKLVHRDIKPGNLLIDRSGTVRILDMGLARFSEEDGAQLTQGGEVLGSPEYMAPEQAVDSHNVDIRADIYALGAMFYYMLAGEAPYSEEKSPAGKLLSKEKRPPKPIRDKCPEVPEELVAVVSKMMAKDAAGRYQTPKEVVAALEPFTKEPIPPPSDAEMPQLSLAARGDTPPKPAPAKAPTKTDAKTAPAAEGEKRPAKKAAKEKLAAEEREAGSDNIALRQVLMVVVVGLCAFVVMYLLRK